ncbi:glycine receptor subunit alpha-1-like, partial [Centruroides sculpturatus]|uniref:glycine receptor subunit alpha-1-like n=1 Tax=Centruroides sculpturatus TaxID=218467 RepID=UPI000C6DDB8F
MYDEISQRTWAKLIPDDYDKYHAPSSENGGPVTVYVNLQIMDIDEIREATMDFRIHLYMTEYWKDPRLNIHKLNLTSTRILPQNYINEIWLPDLVFDNSKWAQLFQFSLPNIVIKIRKDHTIYKVTRYSFQVACKMEMEDYPMDIQFCCFKIAFLANSEETATLAWSGEEGSIYKSLGDSVILIDEIEPLKYEMIKPTPFKVTESWVDGNFSYLICNFTFVRRLTSSILNVYVPSALVVTLSWLSFWLDVSAVPARITLGVTSILTIITQVVQSRSYTPPVSYIKALDIWLFFCTFFVTASLLEYAVAYQFKEPKTKSVSEETKPQSEKWAIRCKECQKELREKLKKKPKRSFWKVFKPKDTTNRFDYYS